MNIHHSCGASMKYKEIKKIVLSTLLSTCCCAAILPMAAFAADTDEAEATGIKLSAVCDRDVSLESGDMFRISARNMRTESDEEILVDGSEIVDSEKNLELTPGMYSVRDITYEGEDESLKNETCSIATVFDSNADFDYVYIAVGDSSTLALQRDYSDIIMKTPERSKELKEQENNLSENAANSEDNNEKSNGMVDAGNEVASESESNEPQLEKDSVETESVEAKNTNKPTETKRNYLLGVIPILVAAVIGGVILYILRKKKVV